MTGQDIEHDRTGRDCGQDRGYDRTDDRTEDMTGQDTGHDMIGEGRTAQDRGQDKTSWTIVPQRGRADFVAGLFVTFICVSSAVPHPPLFIRSLSLKQHICYVKISPLTPF